MKSVVALLLLLLARSAFCSHYETLDVPRSVQDLVGSEYRVITVERGDLNGDGTNDMLVVAERLPKVIADEDVGESLDRVLFILDLSRPNGQQVLARAKDAVGEDDCGGPFGDCYEGVELAGTCLSIQSYGGSSWRVSSDARFCYARNRRTWMLVRATTTTFHVSDPSRQQVVVAAGKTLRSVSIDEYVSAGNYSRR